MLGSANISGSKFMHLMSGNLSHQIEHHLFPDLPSNRYAEIAPKVKALFEKYELNYHEAPLPQQVASAWHKVIRLSLPNGWLATTSAKNAVPQLKMLYKMTTGGPKIRRAAQARLNQQARKVAADLSLLTPADLSPVAETPPTRHFLPLWGTGSDGSVISQEHGRQLSDAGRRGPSGRGVRRAHAAAVSSAASWVVLTPTTCPTPASRAARTPAGSPPPPRPRRRRRRAASRPAGSPPGRACPRPRRRG